MLSIERQEKILSYLKQENQITIKKLSELLFVSANTIRSDVEILEKNGGIIRMHGGIALPSSNFTAPTSSIGIRYMRNIKEKRAMAQEVIKYIPRDRDFSMFIDSSTSSLEFVNLLITLDIHCTIITHFINIAQIVPPTSNITVILCGGTWWAYENCTIGIETLHQLAPYNVDIAIIGCTSIKIGDGIFNGNVETVPIKQTMISNATQTWLLCDSSKFDSSSLLKISEVENIHKVFTDSKPTDEWLTYFEEINVSIIHPS